MFACVTELNDHQRAAVVHRGSPLMVLAGAGTGKTGTLACRVAHLIDEGVEPSRICLLTFSRRAAQEMLARAAGMSSQEAASRVWGGTFHAVASRVLRIHGGHIGLDAGFSVMDQADAGELMGLVRHDVLALEGRERGTGRRFPRSGTLVSIYSRVVNSGLRLRDVVATGFGWCAEEHDAIGAIFEGYTVRKREQRLLDFEDLLLCWRALAIAPGASGVVAGSWDHVLVDEYQDVNAIQADILSALCPDGMGLTVVGDDAQAIYGFRAATSKNLIEFPARFPTATVVRLERNYRSTPAILAVANAVMAAAPPGSVVPKTLWSTAEGRHRPLLRTCVDEATQATAVCDSVLAHREEGVDLRRQAVLYRAGHHADLVELELVRRKVPYVKYGGLRFLEAAHVKDLLALLRLLDNPWDEPAWFRVLQLLDGVGPATARRIMETLAVRRAGGEARGPDSVVTPIARLLAAPPAVPKAAAEDLAGLRAALGELCEGDGVPPAAEVDRLRRWLTPVVERRYDAAAARLADLDQLASAAGASGSRSRFVAELTLDPPVSTGDLAGPPLVDEDWLVLSTVHSAKGGEWDVVHVLHAADGMFPSDLATGDPEGVEEERRLFYVAITRARRVLEINVPFRYHHRGPSPGDGHSYAQMSRFLTEEVRAAMDTQHAGPPCGPRLEVGPVTAGSAGLASVDRWLTGLWS